MALLTAISKEIDSTIKGLEVKGLAARKLPTTLFSWNLITTPIPIFQILQSNEASQLILNMPARGLCQKCSGR